MVRCRWVYGTTAKEGESSYYIKRNTKEVLVVAADSSATTDCNRPSNVNSENRVYSGDEGTLMTT